MFKTFKRCLFHPLVEKLQPRTNQQDDLPDKETEDIVTSAKITDGCTMTSDKLALICSLTADKIKRD